MNLRKIVSSIVALAITSAFLVSTTAANASTEDFADADFWNLGSERPLVATLASSTDPDQVLSPSEIKAATSVSLVFPIRDDLAVSDFTYQWYQSTEAGCSSNSAGSLGSSATVPANRVIEVPAYTANRYLFLMVRTNSVIGAYARTNSVDTGSEPKFCSPTNVSLASATAGERSVTLTFSASDVPAHLSGIAPNISAYLIPAGGPVPNDLSDMNQNYPSQVGCLLASCFIMVDSDDVGQSFDVVYQAMWFAGGQWQRSYYSIARVSVTPLAQHVSCSSQNRIPDCSPVDLLTQPTLDISGGTNPGDTIVISADAVWDTDAANFADEGYSWWWADSCSADRWSRAFFMNLEVPAMVDDFSVSPRMSRQVQDGIVFRLVSEFDNGYLNLKGYEPGPSFIVGGGFCSNSVSNDDSDQAVTTSDVVRAAPFTGPIVTPPTGVTFAPGGKAVLPGSNLTGVSKVTIAGLDAQVKVNSAGELELTVPGSLKPGLYDLVINSDSGTITIQNGIRVSGESTSATSVARPSTKLKEDNTVKVHIFDVVGAGKVQIKLNGKEIAWVNAKDSSNSKLTNGYLARTIDLAPGKNVIEVFVGGKRVDRKAYTN